MKLNLESKFVLYDGTQMPVIGLGTYRVNIFR
jgi:hypothetical protein